MDHQNKNDRTKAILAVLAVIIMVVIAAYFGLKWFGIGPRQPMKSGQDTQPPSTGETQKIPIQKKDSMDLEGSQDLMAKRKAELGLDKGVDMIVRPGETIKIGDSLVSVDEILDKIRLKTGAIDERDIGTPTMDGTARRMIKLPAAIEKLKALSDEYHDIEEQLADLSKIDADKEAKLRKRQAEITGMVGIYRRYQALQNELEKTQTELENATGEKATTLSVKIETLRKDKTALEDLILARIGTDQDLDAYGIYVVKTKDNIWNIHFKFLKDYFTHKGVILSPVADEPASGGESSGVGRLLKFSETMVHIYNIREKKLESDLHLIQPLSKIVVFNLARVFALLESIDYEDVSRIRFDGETLWLPARNE